MQDAAPPARVIKFGAFEADLQTRELRKQGIRIRLQEQPFQVLAMLLERPGELVTRDEIRARLWAQNTFVDFDHGLNAAVRRLRDALNESADLPRYVETLPRRGYRFIGQVQKDFPSEASGNVRSLPAPVVVIPSQPAILPSGTIAPATSTALLPRRRHTLAIAAGVVALVAIAGLLLWRSRPRDVAIDSIAILPFVNETKDPGLDYLTDGITETIINNLAQVPSLKVTSRNAAFVYKGRAVDAKAIAKELGVRAVLLGSVHAIPPAPGTAPGLGDVRLEVELADTRNDRRLWGEQYTVKPLQVNAIQAEISDRVTEKLALHLSSSVRSRMARRHTENNDAFDAYLHGIFFINSRAGNDPYRQALNYFREALGRDPNYALAYTGEASAYGLLAFYGGMAPSEAAPQEEATSKRALQLEPDLADAHMEEGYVLQTLHRDMPAAEQEFLRALKLQPYSGAVHHALALHYSINGRSDEALAEAKRSSELEPLLPTSAGTILWTDYFGHRFGDMAGLLKQPAYQGGCMEGLQQEAIGHYAEALAQMEKLDLPPGAVCSLPHLYAIAGRQAEARLMLNQLLEKRKRQYISAYQIALIYAGLGEQQSMLQWLETADREYDPWMIWLKQDPRFDVYRSLPAFAAIQKHAFTPR